MWQSRERDQNVHRRFADSSHAIDPRIDNCDHIWRQFYRWYTDVQGTHKRRPCLRVSINHNPAVRQNSVYKLTRFSNGATRKSEEIIIGCWRWASGLPRSRKHWKLLSRVNQPSSYRASFIFNASARFCRNVRATNKNFPRRCYSTWNTCRFSYLEIISYVHRVDNVNVNAYRALKYISHTRRITRSREEEI